LNVALLGVVVTAGVVGYRNVHQSQPTAVRQPATRTATAQTGAVTATVSASGTVTSGNVASADFVTAGTVTEIDVAVGDVVAKGRVLAKVDPSEANENLAVARSRLTAAREALTAAESAGSDEATLTNDESAVSQAQSTVDTAGAAVAGTVLTAPIAGTVTALNGSVGSPSSSGFLEISDLTALRVSASFGESDATRLKAGQAASVTWTAVSGTTATGTVTSVAPTATASSGVNSYAVTIALDAAPDGVRLGQSVTAAVTVASAENVLRVPVAAVHGSGGRRTVTVLAADGTTRVVTVTVGVEGDAFDQITSGLTEGQTVVLAVQASATSSGAANGFPGGPGFGG
jgi:macrolide-specific efflux system membrane fusion protein